MFQTTLYPKDQLAKIGNAIVFLCEDLGEIPKTKLLKLLYLIEEHSIKDFGSPFFNLSFKVWKLGPVVPELYTEFSDNPFLLSDFISVHQTDSGNLIKAVKGFEDDEFSNNEIYLMKNILSLYGTKTGNQLVNITHKEGSPWHKAAKNSGLLEAFEQKLTNSSNEDVDIKSLIIDDEYKLSNYLRRKEFLLKSSSFKI